MLYPNYKCLPDVYLAVSFCAEDPSIYHGVFIYPWLPTWEGIDRVRDHMEQVVVRPVSGRLLLIVKLETVRGWGVRS